MLKSIVDKMIQWILEQQALKISGSFSAYFCACHRSPHSGPGRSGPFMGWRGFFFYIDFLIGSVSLASNSGKMELPLMMKSYF